MSQPRNRLCRHKPLGELDVEAGEFWVENPFMMPLNRQNLSAFERNRLFLNVDGASFLDASFASAVDLDSDSRSVVAADFNRDGAADLLVASAGGGPLRLFLNRFASGRRVAIQLVGTAGNRPAIGARLVAHVGTRRIVRDVFPANGFMGQGPAEVLLGLGSARQIDRLEVRWPGGQTQTFADVPADRRVTIVQGRNELRVSAAGWR